MEFVSAQEMADRWNISKRRVQTLCATNRINNAIRIGNMWVVPNNAMKPEDARHKDKGIEVVSRRINPIRVARTEIKSISENAFRVLFSSGFSAVDAKAITVALFASELLCQCCTSVNKNNNLLHADARKIIGSLLMQINQMPEDLSQKLSIDFQRFISNNPFCFDDALAWCYQYINKESGDTGFESTQFFTEKYMITTLVDATDIGMSNGKILDPACGGGNFLLYCFDVLADAEKINTQKDVFNRIENIVVRLVGYEIDPMLAVVASINLRLKALSILARWGASVCIADFLRIQPNIYYSMEATKLGALDCNKSNHFVVSVGDSHKKTMADIFLDVHYLFTNPPFQTVKGMDLELKKYLKINYSSAKCDMCNAFIDLSVKVLKDSGTGGLVTQNSWLYLDSFVSFRKNLLSSCSIKSIVEVGANAFYDLSGEKANVALLSIKKSLPLKEAKMSLVSLKTLPQVQYEQLLSSHADVSSYESIVDQNEVLTRNSVRFDMFSSSHLKEILQHSEPYGSFAIPMQGTSTGNAKELLAYYWQHINDCNWLPVSKGGGYSRWQGLNSYCVKWGVDGEFIKAVPGSAIRNARHFQDTQLVFSDTGTSGLNVRILRQGQLFVASGPGIRVRQGDIYAHMAFLNSRFASYYIRLLSPKLTIAAGYIAKLPVMNELLFSPILASNAKQCLFFKNRRLEKRPCNMEFRPLSFDYKNASLYQIAYAWFTEDIDDEWEQLRCEQAIEDEISKAFALTTLDNETIEAQIGIKRVYGKSNEKLAIEKVKKFLSNLLDSNCMLSRTRANKASLGCDGILEYVAQEFGCSCEAVYDIIKQTTVFSAFFKEQYVNLLLHAIIMSILGLSSFLEDVNTFITIDALVKEVDKRYPSLAKSFSDFSSWLRNDFNLVHSKSFMNTPIYTYYSATDSIKRMKGESI